MSKHSLDLPAEVPQGYEELVRLYRPRKIHDKVDHDNATRVADWIALDAKNAAQLDYLELLGDLLDEYESQGAKPFKSSEPLELLNIWSPKTA
jgi:hypothetical protein